MKKTYDLVGIGNAVVDVISRSDDAFLSAMKIDKGIMQLVDRERGELLYDAMENRQQAPGGSVANTVSAVGTLGLKTAFIGRVRDDELGQFYAQETHRAGTYFANEPIAGDDLPTSRSMIFVSADGERSMNTYLGISAELGPEDVSPAVAGSTRILFLEGYLYDKPKGKAAFDAAAQACRADGGMAGIALSDPFCVNRHRADFQRLVGQLNYVIGNEHEWCALYETEDLETALARGSAACDLLICTRSGENVIVIQNGARTVIPVEKIVAVDATGAGDLFASGFLYGLATGASMEVCGRMGCIAAAEVIGQIGARPKGDLKALFAKAGL